MTRWRATWGMFKKRNIMRGVSRGSRGTAVASSFAPLISTSLFLLRDSSMTLGAAMSTAALQKSIPGSDRNNLAAPPQVQSNASLALPSAAPSARRVVDLRSDTVTKPTPSMRDAMASAEVGDDVMGEDPTVVQLQQRVAEMLGKEAGLFVPSGTMGNLICVLVHCQARGSEAILGSDSHLHYYEQGGMSTLGGVHPRTVPNKADGTMDLRKVELAIRKEDDHFPMTKLICVENTHNRCGGRVVSVEYMEKIGELAKWYNLKLHVDGARLLNAAAALKVSPDSLVQNADSVSLCLSKGIGAPVGSVIVGTSAFIHKARRLRKALGGGMRQVGVLAAAGLVALEDPIPRLQQDHRLARQLAEGLNALEGLEVDMSALETNIVVLEVQSECPLGAEELGSALKSVGVLTLPLSSTKLRLVTHSDLSSEDIRYALATFQELLLRASLEEEEASMFV